MNRVPGFLMIPLSIFLMISVYQTALGFEGWFGSSFSAWMCAIALGMIMFFTAHHAGILKSKRQSIAIYLLIYFICSLFSYLGNFNSLYTSTQGKSLYITELQEKKDKVKEVTTSANKVLANFQPEKRKIVNDILALKNELIMQIKDPSNQGCGSRCRDIKIQLEDLLGRRLTEFGGTAEQQAQNYNKLINNEIKQKHESGDFGKASNLIATNEKTRDEVIKNIDEVLQLDSYIKEYGGSVISDSIDKINTIGINTEEFINDPSVYDYEPQDFKNAEMGSMLFSFRSAISNNLFTFIGLSFFSFFIDWIGVLIILAYMGDKNPSMPNKTKNRDKGPIIL